MKSIIYLSRKCKEILILLQEPKEDDGSKKKISRRIELVMTSSRVFPQHDKKFSLTPTLELQDRRSKIPPAKPRIQ